jgi:hypothetical protein
MGSLEWVVPETTVLTQPRTRPAISVLLGPVAVSATFPYRRGSNMRFRQSINQLGFSIRDPRRAGPGREETKRNVETRGGERAGGMGGRGGGQVVGCLS